MMIKHPLLLLALVFAFTIKLSAQNLPVKTTWEGTLTGVRLILKLDNDSLTHQASGAYDSPDQGALDLKVSSLKITNDSLSAYSTVIGGGFSGAFNKDKSEINGIWKQRGQEFPFIFKRTLDKIEHLRPQTPKAPFPYGEQKLIYFNQDKSIQYGATLTLPKSDKPIPVVILITGSGQEDRDETLFGHKPFWIIADHLSRNGIAVLRVDDRGIGETTGDVMSATSADFAKDVLVGIDFLKTRKEIDVHQIGLVGHSEGGMIAPLVAVQSKDVAFIVSLAGVGVRGMDITNKQMNDAYVKIGFNQEEIGRMQELTDRMVRLGDEYPDKAELKKAFGKSFTAWRAKQSPEFLKKAGLAGGDSDININVMAERFYLPWTRYFMKYDPATTVGKLKVPFLAMNGGKDVQVSAKENLAGFQRLLTKAGNKDFKIVLLPDLNHLFQTAKTGAVSEYMTIEETFSPEALKVMTDWIKLHIN